MPPKLSQLAAEFKEFLDKRDNQARQQLALYAGGPVGQYHAWLSAAERSINGDDNDEMPELEESSDDIVGMNRQLYFFIDPSGNRCHLVEIDNSFHSPEVINWRNNATWFPQWDTPLRKKKHGPVYCLDINSMAGSTFDDIILRSDGHWKEISPNPTQLYNITLEVPLLKEHDNIDAKNFFKGLSDLINFPNLTKIVLRVPVFKGISFDWMRYGDMVVQVDCRIQPPDVVHQLSHFTNEAKSLAWRLKVVCLDIDLGSCSVSRHDPIHCMYETIYDWIASFPSLLVLNIRYGPSNALSIPSYVSGLIEYIRAKHPGENEKQSEPLQIVHSGICTICMIIPGKLSVSDFNHMICNTDLPVSIQVVALLNMIRDYYNSFV